LSETEPTRMAGVLFPAAGSTWPQCLRMTRGVYDEIARTIGSRRAEQGGALGWREGDQIVGFFRLDYTARSTGNTYSPDDMALNAMLRQDWNPRGIRLAGFVHSHPPGIAWPSHGDVAYAGRILAAIPDLPYLILPIVQTEPDAGAFTLTPFVIVRDGGTVRAQAVRLELIDDKPEADPSGGAPPDPAFDRVGDAYDLARMSRARVVAIGVGGAAAFIEDLARCGIGEFVLIDPDTVTPSNIATQQVYRKDFGRPKVTALAERLQDINPAARVRALARASGDLDDAAMHALCSQPLGGPAPVVTLLCGLTDDFTAQARVNALALHLGLPSLCAQVWQEGRGAEITFTYPGLTPACHRCILAPRYTAYLSEGYVNDVTSHGTPIFATTRLNAIKGFLALALLHYPGDGQFPAEPTRFTGLASRIGDRNLLQVRMDPDLVGNLGITTFEKVFHHSEHSSILFDETVWRRQHPRSGKNGEPPCPDCAGTGDLRTARGSFADTRTIRPDSPAAIP
jgi:proteasome lid subunit RPN8/RPN11